MTNNAKQQHIDAAVSLIAQSNAKYIDYKKVCAANGIDAKGSKKDLHERLARFVNGDENQKQYVAEYDNSDVSPDTVSIDMQGKEQNIQKQNIQNMINSSLDNAIAVEASQRWQSLKRKLDLIFAGRAQVLLQENSPPKNGDNGNYSVVFKGLAKQSECVNLDTPDKVILRQASNYVSRVFVVTDPNGVSAQKVMEDFQKYQGG